jgi:hypothetical protein
MAKITVYGFKAYSIDTDTNDPRPVKATRDKIATLKGAEEIPGTGEEIDQSMLNALGFYQPKR